MTVILGGNFSLVGQPSVGASGAIFGTHASAFVDLVAHWSIEYRPKRKLVFLLIELILGVALGYVPGIDNFAHLGGFLMGLLLSVLLYPAIHQTKRHRMVFYVLRTIAIPGVVVLFVVLTRNFYTSDPNAVSFLLFERLLKLKWIVRHVPGVDTSRAGPQHPTIIAKEQA